MFYQGLLEVTEPFYIGVVIFRLFLRKTILFAMGKNDYMGKLKGGDVFHHLKLNTIGDKCS